MREQHGPVTQEQRPERFGNYDIIRPINTGGMGEVYLAHQRSAFGRLVALKIIRSDLVHDRTARARFLREAQVSAQLKHEHILLMLEFGEDQGRLFMVTPYIEGGTLARHLQSGRLSLTEVRQLFVPLVQAVAYIHRHGVIHRDLKPTNILLDDEDGQVYVRLIDFGIASLQGNEASPPLTTAGNEVGTIAYMAPERLNGVAAPSNDIFSLGVILHQMLTGNLPMGDQIDDMPDPMKYVVARCIALRPEDRFASADEVLKQFEHAYQIIMSPTRPGPARLSLPLDSSTIDRLAASTSVRSTQEPSEAEEVILESESQLSSVPPILPVSSVSPLAPVSPVPSVSLPLPGKPAAARAFGPDDYGAQTMSFNQGQRQPSQFAAPAPSAGLTPLPPVAPPVQPHRRKRSLLPLLSALMVVVLLAIGFLAYYGYQTVTITAVTVNFSPKVQALSDRYTITATISAQNVDANAATIPVHDFMANQSGSASGETTGQVNCIFGTLGCQPGVSQEDVDRLSNQERSVLQAGLAQQLRQRVSGAGGTKIADIKFNDVSITSNPAVNQPAQNVTVTLVEQGSIAYYVNADARSVARQLLANHVQRLGSNYVLIGSTVQIGQPVVQSIDNATGKVVLKVAAGGDVVYQFPASQLRAIQSGLVGKTMRVARTFLERQVGIDQSSIRISFTRGNSSTLPTDTQHITVVPINPTNYPAIRLGAAPDATAATLTPTTTPSITPTSSQTTPVVTTTPTITATAATQTPGGGN